MSLPITGRLTEEETVTEKVVSKEKGIEETKEAEDLQAQLADFPDGGRAAWLVVLGAHLMVFCSLGFINTVGTFISYYEENQLSHLPSSTISWIGSVSSWGLFFGGLFAGPLFDKYGAKWITITGSTFLVVGLMLLSVSTKFWHFLLAQGFLMGLSSSMTFVVPIATVNQWFSRNRGMAVGIAISGGSWGSVLWPIMLSEVLFPRFGFAWSVRIAFMCIGLLIVACALTRSRLPPKPPGPLINLDVVRVLPLRLIACGHFFSSLCGFYGFFYLQTYATNNGLITLAPYILAISNASSGFARISIGMLSDRVGRFNMIALCAFGFSAVYFAWTGATSPASVIVIAILFGALSGAVISHMSVCVAICTEDPRKIGSNVGQILVFQSCAALIGPPISAAISGAASSAASGFKHSLIFNGCVGIVAGMFYVADRFVLDRKFLARI